MKNEIFCFDISWTTVNDLNDTMPEWCLTSPNNVLEHKLVKNIQINRILLNTFAKRTETKKEKEVCFQPKLDPLSFTQFCLGNCHCSNFNQTYYEKYESFTTIYNDDHQYQIYPELNYNILSLSGIPKNTIIENELIRLSFDSSANGLLKYWSYFDIDKKQWITMNVSLKIMTFGTRSGGKIVQKSGAYIFLPDNLEPTDFQWFEKPKIYVIIGSIESRYEWKVDKPYPVSIRFSLYRGRPSVELQTEFHLQTQYASNRELIIRFETNINSNDRFYTDLNGFQIISRKRYSKIPLQGNVYPLNSMAWIEDDMHRFSIITGQPLGVTSMHSGTMEIFMDRRLMQDDFRGLNQAVQDNHYTRESFRLMLEPLKSTSRTNNASPLSTSTMMFESQTLLNPIIGFISLENNGLILKKISSFKLLKHQLPCDIHFLNFRRSISNYREFGLWLHRFAFNCDMRCFPKNYYQFNISKLFGDRILMKLNQTIYQTGISLLKDESKLNFINNSLTILPMQIKTFKLNRSK